MNDDMKVFGLHPEWALFRDVWRGKNERFKNK